MTGAELMAGLITWALFFCSGGVNGADTGLPASDGLFNRFCIFAQYNKC